MSRPLPPLRAAAAALLSAALLTAAGCSVVYTPEGASPAPSASEGSGAVSPAASPSPESASSSPPASEDDATAPTASAAPSAPSSPSAGGSSLRDELGPRIATVLTCSGELTVSEPAVAVEVDGGCDALTITADAALVIAGEVGTLRVSGVGSTVLVASAETIEAGGDINEIYWESGTPSVADDGTANVVMPVDRAG